MDRKLASALIGVVIARVPPRARCGAVVIGRVELPVRGSWAFPSGEFGSLERSVKAPTWRSMETPTWRSAYA